MSPGGRQLNLPPRSKSSKPWTIWGFPGNRWSPWPASLAKLDEQVTEGIDRITEQLEKEKKELLAGPAGDAVHEAEDLIAEQKAAISKVLTAAQKEAMGILSPSQRSKALEMIRKIEIPEAGAKARHVPWTQDAEGPPLICSIRSWALCKPCRRTSQRPPAVAPLQALRGSVSRGRLCYLQRRSRIRQVKAGFGACPWPAPGHWHFSQYIVSLVWQDARKTTGAGITHAPPARSACHLNVARHRARIRIGRLLSSFEECLSAFK